MVVDVYPLFSNSNEDEDSKILTLVVRFFKDQVLPAYINKTRLMMCGKN